MNSVLRIPADWPSMSDPRMKLALDVKLGRDPYTSGPRTAASSSTTPSPWTAPSSVSSPVFSAISSPIFSPLTPATPSRELPMPAPRSTTTLPQATQTLTLCSNKLHLLFRHLSSASPGSPAYTALLAEMHRFKPWLDTWECAFSRHLATAMPNMPPEQVRECRIVKANHLACVVLASTPGAGGERELFSTEGRAIVGLAVAVKGETGIVTAANGGSMGIAEPLRVVVACCGDGVVRAQAMELLEMLT
ncbi:hypothetical protein B0A48_05469 [Cryoendolithus antarcticus]|uniref:Uncharacterized protein n=1 Tax=Cryoendolithus antarcticus TaxID=1507870 RepID=A0A1V8TIK5_9PEZI|nr:hypothetical protein B0A48_05469 [Cryoendolithus antarcticus]